MLCSFSWLAYIPRCGHPVIAAGVILRDIWLFPDDMVVLAYNPSILKDHCES